MPKKPTKKSSPVATKSATRAATKSAKPSTDSREQTLARIRMLIFQADPAMVEERKWKKPSNKMAGVPVWSHPVEGRAGIVCTGETYKQVVKLTFAEGAKLSDPAGLFNSSLEGNTRRAIDLREGEQLDAAAFKALIKAAVALNGPAEKKPATKASEKAKPAAKATKTSATKPAPKTKSAPNAKPAHPPLKKNADGVVLLSGGNPQIAKADGDAPVQAFIAAMPGWKRDVGRRLDALIVRTVPNVRKAVRWNTPFYGIDGNGWFLGFHCITKYVKVAFFRGTSLTPLPPGESKQKDVRYLDIFENAPLDEKQLARWIKQAAALPGEKLF